MNRCLAGLGGLLQALILAVAIATVTTPGFAQRATQSDAIAWIDAALAAARSAGASGATRGDVTVGADGRMVVADVTITTGGVAPVSIGIARITGQGVETSGGRFRAATLAAEGLVVTAGRVRVAIPALTLAQVDTPVFTPQAVFGGDGTGIVATLRGASLQRGTIPMGTIRIGEGSESFTLEMRDIVLDRLTRGVLARFGVGPTSIQGETPQSGAITGQLGDFFVETFDIALYAALFAPAPASESRDLRMLSERGAMSPSVIEIAGTQSRISIGAVTAGRNLMRIPSMSLREFGELSRQIEGQARNAPAAVRQRFAAGFEDYLTLGRVEATSIDGMSIESPAGTMRLARLSIGTFFSTRIGSMALEGFDLRTPDVQARIGRFGITEFDWTETLRAVIREIAAGNDPPNPQALEGKLPTLELAEIRDMAITQPRDGTISVDRIALGIGRWIGFVPSDLRLQVAALTIPGELVGRGLAPPTPVQLGYDRLAISADIRKRVDTAAETATLAPGRVSIADLGALELEIALGDVAEEYLGTRLLSEATELMSEVTVRRIRLKVENAGFLERFLAFTQGAGQRRDPAQIRRETVEGLVPLTQVFIRDAALRRTVAEAVRSFAREGRSFTIVATPREEMTIQDLVEAMSNPQEALAAFNLRITTND